MVFWAAQVAVPRVVVVLPAVGPPGKEMPAVACRVSKRWVAAAAVLVQLLQGLMVARVFLFDGLPTQA